MGRVYENGIGRNIDLKKALDFYTKAKLKGNKGADKAIARLTERVAE